MTLVPPLPYIGRKQQVGLFRNKSTSSIFWGKKVQKNFHEKHFQNMQKSIVCKKVLFVETTHGRLSRQIMPLFWRFLFYFVKKVISRIFGTLHLRNYVFSIYLLHTTKTF